MFTWLYNLRNPNTRSRPRLIRPAALALESLEVREVPALLGATVHNVLGLVNDAVALVGSLGGSGGGSGGSGPQGGNGSSQSPPPAPTGTASISGTVQYSMGGGDSIGPLAGATVTLTDANGNVVATATTDANGNYTLGQLAAGSYTITVSANGYNTQTQSVTLTNGQAATDNFTLS
jgi:hypothetical protein